jgi:hypothetical protein
MLENMLGRDKYIHESDTGPATIWYVPWSDAHFTETVTTPSEVLPVVGNNTIGYTISANHSRGRATK